MVLLQPEFVFDGTAEDRKRICECILDAFFFLQEDYPRAYRLYRETVVTGKNITMKFLNWTHKQIKWQFLLTRANARVRLIRGKYNMYECTKYLLKI